MESLLDVATVLQRRGLEHIPNALLEASVEFREEWEGFTVDYVYHVVATAVVSAPFSDYDYLISLHSQHKQLILKTIQEVWPVREDGTQLTVREIEFRLIRDSLREAVTSADGLIQQLDSIRNTLIAVSTGGPRINSVNSEYKERYFAFTDSLRNQGLENPIPYSDLWDWYGKWSGDPNLDNYQSRREYVRSLCEPLEKNLRQDVASQNRDLFRESTGWDRVDRSLVAIRSRLASASTEEQFQEVGLLCRETLISLAQTVFDADSHIPIYEEPPSHTDAKQMLDRYLAAEVKGKPNYSARRLAKVAVDLANEVQHKRTAEFRDAALCAQATTSVVNIIAIISGARDTQ